MNKKSLNLKVLLLLIVLIIFLMVFLGSYFLNLVLSFFNEAFEIKPLDTLITSENVSKEYIFKNCFYSIYEGFKFILEDNSSQIKFAYLGQDSEDSKFYYLCSFRIKKVEVSENSTYFTLHTPFLLIDEPWIKENQKKYQTYNFLFFITGLINFFIFFKKNKIIAFLFSGISFGLILKNNVLLIILFPLVLILLKKLKLNDLIHYTIFVLVSISLSSFLTTSSNFQINSNELWDRPDVQAYKELSNLLKDKTIISNEYISTRNLILISPTSLNTVMKKNYSIANIDQAVFEDKNFININWINTATTQSFYIPVYDFKLDKDSLIKIGLGEVLVPYFDLDKNILYFIDVALLKS